MKTSIPPGTGLRGPSIKALLKPATSRHSPGDYGRWRLLHGSGGELRVWRKLPKKDGGSVEGV